MGPDSEKASDAVEMETPARAATCASVGFVADIAGAFGWDAIDDKDSVLENYMGGSNRFDTGRGSAARLYLLDTH